MRYSSIRKCDISNGEGVGVSIFLQGCSLHCEGCFNIDTWDFDGGKELTDEVINYFIDELAIKPHIKHISILGGEPLHDRNVLDTLDLIFKIRDRNIYDAKIWLWSGFTLNSIIKNNADYVASTIFDPIIYSGHRVYLPDINNPQEWKKYIDRSKYDAFCFVDYFIDGPFIESLKDFNLKFRGSSNQRIIDVKETLKKIESDYDFSHYCQYDTLLSDYKKLTNPIDIDKIVDNDIVLYLK